MLRVLEILVERGILLGFGLVSHTGLILDVTRPTLPDSLNTPKTLICLAIPVESARCDKVFDKVKDISTRASTPILTATING